MKWAFVALVQLPMQKEKIKMKKKGCSRRERKRKYL